ncbi:hypothetical protein C942_04250 [Photobacterium marinum]|uniref:Periplasmic protein n=1 Tax=Photobacterium marinum TaxID=1056511 RepID=L8JGJ8_9GAMM|nr:MULTISPECIES: hypothetical protein [Photobacterium]ELR66552.1 hypothetical protein C942_04250 [Photobacterium marinum]
MKKVLVLLCLVFSGFALANSMSGGSQVTVPHVVCMQDGKMLGVTSMPVTECNKLKAEHAKKASKEESKY